MSNPAWQLHAVYTELRTAAEPAQHSLDGLTQIYSEDGHRRWTTCAALLTRIETLLETLEREGHRVAVYRKMVRHFKTPLTGTIAGWEGAINPDGVITQDRLDQLEAVAAFLDGKVHELSAGDMTDLGLVVDKAASLLQDDVSLPVPLRRYIHRLLQAIRHALEDEAIGETFDFDASVTQLWIALQAAASTSTEKESFWKALAGEIVVGVSSGVLGQLATFGVQTAIGS